MSAAVKKTAKADLAASATFEQLVDAFKTLLAKIEEEVKALEERIGPGNVALVQVESIVRRALDDFDWGALRGLIVKELLLLLLSGRSVVKDDDTDIA